MRPLIASLLYLLCTTTVCAEVIAFKPGEISSTVKGRLIAEQTREYVFHGRKGQRFDIAASSDRGQWLIMHVRDEDKHDVFNNFDSDRLSTKGVLPKDGDYTVFLALRRAEAQREGELDYVLTVTLHPEAAPIAIEKGRGEYFVSDGAGTRAVRGVAVGLGSGGDAQVTISLDGDGLDLKGHWQAQNDEAILIDITEAFGQRATGQAMVLLDDELVDEGEPTHILLRFDSEQGTHHTLYYYGD